ncbi:MAG: adaptor protein MecA [Lachnospiraceae bacterium]|nr:adaptor protein MecA [Lachnospiraceae bacterium]
MKIEKINDNQIRCTLTKQDLSERELRLSELAYGSEKAKDLFRDMMNQAAVEVNFEANDYPLMIEAIPTGPDSLMLIITRVDDPDELDTRFSKFSPDHEVEDYTSEDDDEPAYADEVLTLYEKLQNELEEKEASKGSFMEVLKNELSQEDSDSDTDSEFTPLSEAITQKEKKKKKGAKAKKTKVPVLDVNVFIFDSLDDVTEYAYHITDAYHGKNTLYKDTVSNLYYLAMEKSDHTPKEFNRVCNTAYEFGRSTKSTYASVDYYEEHFEVIIRDTAIQILSVI